MIHRADKEFVERCLDNYVAKTRLVGVAKEPPFEREDGGVPFAMFDGEVDGEGWVQWKMIDSTVTENDIVEIEKMLPGQFPPLFRAFLTTRFTMEIETPHVRLPALPCDNPFGELFSTLRGWATLFSANYVAFAADGNDAGCLCFDFGNRLPDADCPIIIFDHEQLITLGEQLCGAREQTSPLAIPVYDSFRQLLESVCF